MTVTDFYAAWDAKKQATTPTSAPITPIVASEATPYGQRALNQELNRVANAPEGTRNHTLNSAAFSLAQLVQTGHLNETETHQALHAAARTAGLPPTEIDATLASAGRAAPAKPRVNVPAPDEPLPHPIPDVTTITPATPGSDSSNGSGGEGSENTNATELEQWREVQIAQEAERLRIRRAAEHAINAEEVAKTWREPPYRTTLTEELAIPDEPVTYLIDEILPTGGNVLLTAQYKTGKTTLVNAVARSLADQQKFLNKYDTSHEKGRIALWNYEVDERQYRRWLREVRIENTNKVSVLNLRGYRMPLLVSHVEDWVVNWLETHEITTWIVDPFARAFVGSGKSENDNTEVGEFLDTLDVIKDRAGVSELILPTHTGRAEMDKGEERARGATRLDDWADVRWLLTKDEHDIRYFRATGRDVDTDEERLNYNETTRSLTLGGGDRSFERNRRRTQAVVDIVTAQPGINLAALRDALRKHGIKGKNEAINAAISEAEYTRQIIVDRTGTGAPTRHFPASVTVIERSELA